MANIYDVANELSRTLRDLPEYKAVVESKQAIEANPEAKTLFDEYVGSFHALLHKLRPARPRSMLKHEENG